MNVTEVRDVQFSKALVPILVVFNVIFDNDEQPENDAKLTDQSFSNGNDTKLRQPLKAPPPTERDVPLNSTVSNTSHP